VLIPLGTDRPSKRRSVVTPTLVGINIAVFVIMALLHNANQDLAMRIDYFGAISSTHFRPWQPITSAFMHAGFMHIFGNMLFLLAFGPSVEDRFGRVGFTLFYLAGGIASGFAHITVSQSPAVGASGAIAAVSGAFLILFPSTKIKCFVIFFIIGIFMIPSWWLIGLFIVLDLGAQVFTPDNGIANIAHLGGYGFGAAVAFLLLVTKILPKEQYDMFSIAKHRKRRADFKVAHEMHNLAGVYQHDQKLDPVMSEIADHRASIGASIATDDLNSAAREYLMMIEKYNDKESSDQSKLLTMNRDAQYKLANHFYQTNNRKAALDAFVRLIDAYPNDPERDVITVLIARIHANDLNDSVRGIEMLEELQSKTINPEIKERIANDLDAIRKSHAESQ
jgi:membrane associated rhomboid family serine protease